MRKGDNMKSKAAHRRGKHGTQQEFEHACNLLFEIEYLLPLLPERDGYLGEGLLRQAEIRRFLHAVQYDVAVDFNW